MNDTFDIITAAHLDEIGPRRTILTIETSYPDGAPHVHVELYVCHEDLKVQRSGQEALRILGSVCDITADTDIGDLIGCRMPQSVAAELSAMGFVGKHNGSDATNDNGTSIYVIACDKDDDQLCKVGIAGSPERRLRQLSTASPHPLRLEYTRRVHNARRVEAWAHKFFGQWRKNGEWFEVPAAILIERINKEIDGQTGRAA